MQQHIEIRSRTFSPAAVGAGETTALFNINKGERVLWASALPLIAAAAATDTTMVLGDGTATNGLIAAIDLEASAVGTAINGGGSFLANSGGKLYTAADTIDVVYAGTVFGATNPKVRFTIAVVREYPA